MKTYELTLAGFSVIDKLEQIRFFEKIFLFADISIRVVLIMSFVSLNNVYVYFDAKEFIWRTYTVSEVMFLTKEVELFDKHNFVKLVLNENYKTFFIHIATLKIPATMLIYPSQIAQIAALLWDNAPTKIPAKYANYANIFSFDLAIKISENTGINKYAIEVVKGKQSSYRLIYTLSLVELEILKAYIETQLKTVFIWPSKSPASTLIIFDKKPDSSLHFYIDYWGLNNLIIKN